VQKPQPQSSDLIYGRFFLGEGGNVGFEPGTSEPQPCSKYVTTELLSSVPYSGRPSTDHRAAKTELNHCVCLIMAVTSIHA